MRTVGTERLVATIVAAMAVVLLRGSDARADLFGTVTYTEPAETLVMPFDNTTDKVSFQIVSRIGGADAVVATHWSYWADDCSHLADVFICLTQRDTVVVDPRHLRSELQRDDANLAQGPVIDLSGHKGMVVVTAFSASADSLTRDECAPAEPLATLADQIVGAWTIANSTTNASFGNDAIGLSTSNFVGDEASSFLGDSSFCIPFFIPTYNPAALTDSSVILMTVQFDTGEFGAGHGPFKILEIGPIATPGSPKVCCDATFVDNLEVPTSLPDVCFECVGFAPIADGLGEPGQVPIIPPTTAVNTSGLVQLCRCTTNDPDGGGRVAIGENSVAQFILGFHGLAVGPFGAAITAKYSGGLTIN
jgi:hypothetical protein